MRDYLPAFIWNINPIGGIGSDYKVSVQSISQPGIKDMSNNNFVISTAATTPKITVLSPNGAETWKRGTTQTVKWNYANNPCSYVKIMLVKAGVEVGTISASTSLGSGGKGDYTWSIYPTGSTGTDYKVSVSCISQPTIKDLSNYNFALTL